MFPGKVVDQLFERLLSIDALVDASTEALEPKPELRPVLTSAENGLGIGEIWKCIDQALAGKRAGNKEPS